MIFSCEKALLIAALNSASRVVSTKSSLQVLEGVLIEAGEAVSITGYDLKTGIRTSIPAEIRERGSIVLIANLFSGIIKKLPDDIVTISVNSKNVTTIKCGMSEFNIMGMSPDDFPELPSVDTDNYIELPQSTLRSMINDTLFAVSVNESSRVVHTGSQFDISGKKLTVVSLDGYRLAVRREEIEDCELYDCSFVVPATALSEVEKLAADSEDRVRISVGEKHIIFELEDSILVSRRLEGEFLDYKKAVPENAKYSFEADRRELLSSVERVSFIINDRLKSPIHVIFRSGELELNATTSLGRSLDFCSIDGECESFEAGFNNRYLLDALKAAPADRISMETTNAISPFVIRPTDKNDDSFVYMVLPVRIKAGE